MARMMRKSDRATSTSDVALLLFYGVSDYWFATFPIARTKSTARLHSRLAVSTPRHRCRDRAQGLGRWL
jgi:hypothetical protein